MPIPSKSVSAPSADEPHSKRLDVPELEGSIQKYFKLGLAPASHHTYNAALKRFYLFCTKFNITTPFPVSERILCAFTAYLADKNLSPQTGKVYLSAVRNMQISLGLPDPRDQSSLPILKRVQAGVARAAKSRGKAPRIRLPITYQLLTLIQNHLTITNHQERTVIWAIACTAFFGFFRLGELLPTSDETQGLSKCLLWEDVAVDDRTNPTMFKLFLQQSKWDQFGTGAHIILGRTTGQACPVSALTRYLEAHPHTQGPLFLDSQEKPVKKTWFVTEIRTILRTLGYPQDKYAGHSFRIGAATAAAQNGLEDSVTKTLGRWQSSAFLQYIKTPQTHLATLSQSLTKGTL